MEPWALRWTRCFGETIFSSVGLVNLERGAFNLPESCIALTGYTRLTSYVEGTLAVRLRFGHQANAEFSGGLQFPNLAGLNASKYTSLTIHPTGGSGGTFAPRGSFPVIYSPHVTVRITALLGAGGTVDLSYEVWCAALVAG